MTTADTKPAQSHAATTLLKAPPRPDQKAYEAKSAELQQTIEELKVKATKVREEIAAQSGDNKAVGPRQEITDKMNALKAEEQAHRAARNKVFEELKLSQETLKKKIEEVKMARDRVPFKSLADVDHKIMELEAMVESGQLKVIDEKKCLGEVSQLRKMRKQFDGFVPQEAAIDATKAKIATLRKQLDGFEPEYKTIKKQLDELYTKLRALNSEKDESFSKMQLLFKERDALTKQINTLQKERRDLAEANHKAHNAWYNWQKVENARKEEMYKAQRAEQDKAKKLEQIERAKEAAALPAFEVELAQVHSLVVLLQKMMDPTGGRATAASSSGASDLPVSKSNVPAARQASDAAALPKGVAVATPLKKKSDRWEEELFYAATPKGGKKKGMAAGNSPTAPASGKLKFDLSVMDQFLALKVDMVTKYEDIPMAIAALEKKRQFFLENRDRVTKENMAKAMAMEAKLLNNMNAPVEEAAAVDENGDNKSEVVVAAA